MVRIFHDTKSPAAVETVGLTMPHAPQAGTRVVTDRTVAHFYASALNYCTGASFYYGCTPFYYLCSRVE